MTMTGNKGGAAVRTAAAGVATAIVLFMMLAAFGLSTLPAEAQTSCSKAACSPTQNCCAGYACVDGTCVQQAAPWFRIVPECATVKGEFGKAPPVPSLVCALQTFGNIAMLILGITGSVALLMFVYGGFLMITSAGKSEQVSKGKTVLTNSIIGIIIIMTSGMMVQYAMTQIGVKQQTSVGMTCKTTKDESGITVQKYDGSFACVKNCAELTAFSCVNVNASPGLYCIPNLCPGKRDSMCCYQPEPQ